MERLEIIAKKARQFGMSTLASERMRHLNTPEKLHRAWAKRVRKAEKRLANGL